MAVSGQKKNEVSQISHVTNQEGWDTLMRHTGLVVADIYQEWNGPCKPMNSMFLKLHAQINDEKVLFAQVKVNNIRTLNLYIGKCEPTFLLFGSGNLIGVLRGSDAPGLKRLILEKFDEELKVLRGEIERTIIKDPGIRRIASNEDQFNEDMYEFYMFEMTFCIIKPDIVSNGKVDDVIQMLKDEGFEIVRQEQRKLNVEEVSQMYKKLKREDYMNEVLSYMTTGISCVMALCADPSENPVEKLRSITGNKDVEKAREDDPDSLRAIFGTSGYLNGIHTSESREEAIKSISLMFPDLVYKKSDDNIKEHEKVIIAIPKAVYSNEDNMILGYFEEYGFKLDQKVTTTILKPDINYLYANIIEYKDIIDARVEEMYGSEFTVIALERKDSVKIARYMLYLYTPEEDEEIDVSKLMINGETPDLIFCSDDVKSAIRDYKFFFPNEVTFGMIKPDAYEMKDEIIQLIKAAGFEIPIEQEMVLSVDNVEEIYRKLKDASFFNDLVANMTSGPSVLMVLSKYNGIHDYKSLIGVSDPEEAADQGQDKLRGIFGSTIIQNAVHGASTKNEAMHCINYFFGNIHFDHLGNVCGRRNKENKIYPSRVYRPITIDETRIQDILNKCGADKGETPKVYQKELSLKRLARMYAPIKNVESYPNLKCFIEVASHIIPVLFNEESYAFEALDKLNLYPNTQKNFKIREYSWLKNFVENMVVVERNFAIYCFGNFEGQESVLRQTSTQLS